MCAVQNLLALCAKCDSNNAPLTLCVLVARGACERSRFLVMETVLSLPPDNWDAMTGEGADGGGAGVVLFGCREAAFGG